MSLWKSIRIALVACVLATAVGVPYDITIANAQATLADAMLSEADLPDGFSIVDESSGTTSASRFYWRWLGRTPVSASASYFLASSLALVVSGVPEPGSLDAFVAATNGQYIEAAESDGEDYIRSGPAIGNETRWYYFATPDVIPAATYVVAFRQGNGFAMVSASGDTDTVQLSDVISLAYIVAARLAIVQPAVLASITAPEPLAVQPLPNTPAPAQPTSIPSPTRVVLVTPPEENHVVSAQIRCQSAQTTMTTQANMAQSQLTAIGIRMGMSSSDATTAAVIDIQSFLRNTGDNGSCGTIGPFVRLSDEIYLMNCLNERILRRQSALDAYISLSSDIATRMSDPRRQTTQQQQSIRTEWIRLIRELQSQFWLGPCNP